jgi:hypothetical protein
MSSMTLIELMIRVVSQDEDSRREELAREEEREKLPEVNALRVGWRVDIGDEKSERDVVIGRRQSPPDRTPHARVQPYADATQQDEQANKHI